MVLIIAAAMIVFQVFLIFSSMSFMWLLLIMLPVVIFGFYLNYDLRTMVITPELTSGQTNFIRLWN